ncbi:MAG: ISNCY family transposase [Candidatus Baltobacteraceae bacterium]
MELLTMSTTELSRLAAMERLKASEITQSQASGQLGLSLRQTKRLWKRFRAQGPSGLQSRRRGKPSNRRFNPEVLARALELVKAHYADFGPTFAAEKLLERHDLRLDHETLRRAMIAAGAWKCGHRKRVRIHPPRARRPCFGELAQIDGSHHAWFENRGPKCTLYVDIDDATSSLLALHFAEQETTEGYFELTRQHALEHGLPLAFYTDKYGVFRINRTCSPQKPTQFGRAMQELGIELICANSPQAKGRVERANGTLQTRFVRELRLHCRLAIKTRTIQRRPLINSIAYCRHNINGRSAKTLRCNLEVCTSNFWSRSKRVACAIRPCSCATIARAHSLLNAREFHCRIAWQRQHPQRQSIHAKKF